MFEWLWLDVDIIPPASKRMSLLTVLTLSRTQGAGVNVQAYSRQLSYSNTKSSFACPTSGSDGFLTVHITCTTRGLKINDLGLLLGLSSSSSRSAGVESSGLTVPA